MKTCFKCERELAESEFYRHPMMADGTRNDSTTRRNAKLEEVRAYDRKRGSRLTAEDVRRYREENPEKHAAHVAVQNAIRTGRLVREPCERCPTVHAHHDDYAKPLEVRWLCAAHHKERHAELAKESNHARAQTHSVG